jgi:hypothetical protein
MNRIILKYVLKKKDVKITGPTGSRQDLVDGFVNTAVNLQALRKARNLTS